VLPVVTVLLTRAVITGVVETVKVWLDRSRDRSVHFAWEVNDEKGELTVTARTVDNATAQTLAEHAGQAVTEALREALDAQPEEPPRSDGDPLPDPDSGD